MSKAKMGAQVQYCGHDASFVADIYLIEGANVVRANGPLDLSGKKHLKRPAGKCTHQIVDFPKGGFWRPELGIFVVPANQVTEL